MKLLFVADPLESLQDHKDSTFAMMREAAKRGHEIVACEPTQLVWQRGGASRRAVRGILRSRATRPDWFVTEQVADLALADAGAVLMRKDPP